MGDQLSNTPAVTGSGTPGSDPSATPQAGLQGDPRVNLPNPLTGAGSEQGSPEGAPSAAPETAPAGTPAQERLFAGKYKTPEELEKAYQEAERNFHLGNQERSFLQKQLEQQQQLLAQLMQQQQSQPYAQPQLSPEELKAQQEEWLEQFYENPQQALSEVIGQEIQKAIEPLVQQQQYQQYYTSLERQVNHIRQTDPEQFEQLYPELVNFLQSDQGRALAYSVPNGVEMAYQVLKAQRMSSLTPETIVQDPHWRQKLLENQELRNAILQQYGQQIQQNQPPIVISGNQPSNIPAQPVPDIKTVEQAKAASIPFFQQFFKRGGSQ